MGDDETEEPSGGDPQAGVASPKRSFSFLDTDAYKDVRSPLIGKFLKDHIDRLEEEVTELKPFREKYYDVRSKLQVLEERKGLTRTAAGVSAVMLAIGGVGIGVAKDLWEVGSSGFVVGIASILLIASSFLMKVRAS